MNISSKINLTIIEEGANHILRISVPVTVYEIIKSYMPADEEYVSSVSAREILEGRGYFCKTNTTLKKYAAINKVDSKIQGKGRYFNREQLYNIPQK